MIKFLAGLLVGGAVGMVATVLCLAQKDADDTFPDIEGEDEPDVLDEDDEDDVDRYTYCDLSDDEAAEIMYKAYGLDWDI